MATGLEKVSFHSNPKECSNYHTIALVSHASQRSIGEGIGYPLQYCWASLVTQLVKNPPAMWETWVQSLGWEDLLEKG